MADGRRVVVDGVRRQLSLSHRMMGIAGWLEMLVFRVHGHGLWLK